MLGAGGHGSTGRRQEGLSSGLRATRGPPWACFGALGSTLTSPLILTHSQEPLAGGWEGDNEGHAGRNREEVTSVESRSSGLSGGRRVPRKVRAAPLCQTASVRASRGDSTAEQLLRSRSSGRSRGLCGARGRGGATDLMLLRDGLVRHPLPWPGVPLPQSQHAHTLPQQHTQGARQRHTFAHTCVSHSRGRARGRPHTLVPGPR